MTNRLFSTILILLVSSLVFAQTDSSKVIATSSQNTSDSIPHKPEQIFSFAEVMPTFPGDAGAFQTYLHENIKYPLEEFKAKKQGTVYITFTIEKDGAISDVYAAKEVVGCPGFTAEAVRVIAAMPKWNPGKMNGRNVRVTITQPVRFSLN